MINLKKFKQLLSIKNTTHPFVSLYIPTYRAGNRQEDRLRFKNAISEAVTQLCDDHLFPDTAMTKKEAYEYMAPAAVLYDDDKIWSNLSDGLAVFLNGTQMEYFTVPVNFQNFVFVGNEFYVRHLLPILNKEDKFFILALSQNDVRFFEARENSITPVKINDLVPNGIDEMIGIEDNEQVLQMHSGGDAIFHGQGGKKDDKNKQLHKYFREIDKGLMTMLHDETAPLIIYAVDYEVPMYKEVSKYNNITDTSISGNPEGADPVLVHEKAWAQIHPHFDLQKIKQTQIFDEALAADKASFSIAHIIPAAFNGKVETLYVDADTKEIWGEFDPSTNKMKTHQNRQPNSIGLLNQSALATFNSGGKVYNISRTEFPKVVSQMNAIYRY